MDLPATLVFDYPTVSAISSYISSIIASAAAHAAYSEEASEAESDVAAEGVVLFRPSVSLAADRYQAEAVLTAVTRLASRTAAGDAVMIMAGRDASRKVPFNRWQVDRQQQVCTNCM